MAEVTFANAVSAYANGAARAIDTMRQGSEFGAPGQVGPGSARGAAQGVVLGGSNFGDLLGRTLDAARAAGLGAEAQSVNAVKGEASLHQVVASVASAEVTLQTVVAVRDRVINAYQEILRMPI